MSLDATFSGISWHGVTGNRRAVPPQARCRGSYEHICVDLMDAAHCRAQLSHLTDVTRFLCRVRGRSRPRGTGEPEFDLLRNLVETIEPVAVDLQHIHFMQGSSRTAHLGPYRTPAREDDPRHPPPNFYYDQWDYMVGRQRGKSWTYRPRGFTRSAASPLAIRAT